MQEKTSQFRQKMSPQQIEYALRFFVIQHLIKCWLSEIKL